jgi:hypothetical protein
MFAIVLQFTFCAAIDAARPDFVSLLSPVCFPSRALLVIQRAKLKSFCLDFFTSSSA